MQLIEVSPVIPAALTRLPELAANLSYSWHRPTRALFEDLDQALWRQTHSSPRLMLRCVSQAALDQAAEDPYYLRRYEEALAEYDRYQSQEAEHSGQPLIAYFCAEFGIHESLPIYSGGLGILAGDHCKAASDEQLNFIGVGLLYRQGYFTQSVDSDGVQHAGYRDADPRDLPLEPVINEQGLWLSVRVPVAEREVEARLWRAQVGHVSVYLLDTNTAANNEADRDITYRLYGGDESVRIKQEMVLGIGGVRALRALGLAPAVWHMNEGHAAFLVLELLREHLGLGRSFEAGLEAIAAQSVFTTHTPVAAGHDAFHDHLFIAHFGAMARSMGVTVDKLLELGRAPGVNGWFDMTRLALNGARRINGVSRIHGGVSSQLCSNAWPEIAPTENPVGYVTNGVHVPTFLSSVWANYLDERLPQWRDRLSRHAVLERGGPAAGCRVLGRRAGRQVAHAAGGAGAPGAGIPAQAPGLGAAAAHHAVHRPGKSQCPDHRLCTPLRHLQARRADHARPPAPAAPGVGSGAAGAVPVCRQGASGRPARAAGAARDQAAEPDAGVCRTGRVPRGLRHTAGAVAGHRRGRVAQQSHLAAGSQRHVGHQGRGQWPPQPLDTRRLVGRGLRWRQWLGHSRRRRGRGTSP